MSRPWEAEPGGREECGGAARCLCGAPGSDRPPRGPEEQAKGSGHGGTTRMGTADCHMQRTDRRRGGRGDGGAVWSTTAESHAGGTADPAEIQADCGADNAPSADCCSQAATFAVPEPVCCGGGPDWHGGPHDRWVRDADGGAPYSCSPSLRTTRPSPYPVSPKTHRMPIRTIGRTEASTATPGSSLADRLSKQKPAADVERTEVTEMIIDDEEELLDRLGKPKEGHLEMD